MPDNRLHLYTLRGNFYFDMKFMHLGKITDIIFPAVDCVHTAAVLGLPQLAPDATVDQRRSQIAQFLGVYS